MGRTNIYTGLLWTKPERKGPLGIPRNRWDVNIHVGVKVMGYEGMGWFNVVQDREHLGGCGECGNEV